MAVDPQYMVDNSAWNRLKYDAVAARLKPLLDANLVATCVRSRLRLCIQRGTQRIMRS